MRRSPSLVWGMQAKERMTPEQFQELLVGVVQVLPRATAQDFLLATRMQPLHSPTSWQHSTAAARRQHAARAAQAGASRQQQQQPAATHADDPSRANQPYPSLEDLLGDDGASAAPQPSGRPPAASHGASALQQAGPSQDPARDEVSAEAVLQARQAQVSAFSSEALEAAAQGVRLSDEEADAPGTPVTDRAQQYASMLGSRGKRKRGSNGAAASAEQEDLQQRDTEPSAGKEQDAVSSSPVPEVCLSARVAGTDLPVSAAGQHAVISACRTDICLPSTSEQASRALQTLQTGNEFAGHT